MSLSCLFEGAVSRWTGHVTRMRNDRIPKKLLYGRLVTGMSSRGNQLTYINQAKKILRGCDIVSGNLEALAASRVDWRKKWKDGTALSEDTRIADLSYSKEGET